MPQTQDIVTKINILLQEICDIKLKNQKKKIFSDHKNHPKGIDEEIDLDDTRSIYNSAPIHLLPDKQNTPEHHVPNPDHTPNIDDSAFAQQKLDPYKLWSASPPELLSSSSFNEDSMDNNTDCARYTLMKTGCPQKRVGRREGELEMEGERETRGGMEEERPGPSSNAVTKLSGPEPDSESGRH